MYEAYSKSNGGLLSYLNIGGSEQSLPRAAPSFNRFLKPLELLCWFVVIVLTIRQSWSARPLFEYCAQMDHWLPKFIGSHVWFTWIYSITSDKKKKKGLTMVSKLQTGRANVHDEDKIVWKVDQSLQYKILVENILISPDQRTFFFFLSSCAWNPRLGGQRFEGDEELMNWFNSQAANFYSKRLRVAQSS